MDDTHGRTTTPVARRRTLLAVVVVLMLVLGGVAAVIASVSPATTPSRSSAPKPSVEMVPPELAQARSAASQRVELLLGVANNASGVASPDAVAALQVDVAGLDTASRVGTQAELDAAAAEAEAALAAFAVSAADMCEANLAAGAGGPSWALAASPGCAAVREAATGAGDVVPALLALEEAGAPGSR